MSMLGISILNEVLTKINEDKASKVLNNLRKELIKALHQTGKKKETKDGINIAFCIIDFENKQVQYSGAYNPSNSHFKVPNLILYF